MISDRISRILTRLSTQFVVLTAMAIIVIWLDWAEPNLALFLWLAVFGLEVSEQIAEEYFASKNSLAGCVLSLLIYLPWATAGLWLLDGLNMAWFVPLLSVVGGFCVFTATTLKRSER